MIDFKGLYEATIASSGIVQGLYETYRKENKDDNETALRLTEITWNGIMLASRPEESEKW